MSWKFWESEAAVKFREEAEQLEALAAQEELKRLAIEATKPKISPNGMEYVTTKQTTKPAHDIKNNDKLGQFIVREFGKVRLLYQIYSIATNFDIYYDKDGKEVDYVKREDQPALPDYWLTPIKILMEENYYAVISAHEHEMDKMLKTARNDYTARKVIDKLIAKRLK